MANITEKEDDKCLKWPRLIQGILIRRYQRFKADVKLRNGHIVTALCPNTAHDYGRELREAIKKGVEILAYDVNIDLEGISLNRALPFRM